MNATTEFCRRLGLPARPAIDLFPNSAVVPIAFDSPLLRQLEGAGYRLVPSGPQATLVRETKETG